MEREQCRVKEIKKGEGRRRISEEHVRERGCVKGREGDLI